MQYSGFNGIFQIWREITACDVYRFDQYRFNAPAFA
jgi:hypothetical protein